MEINSDAFKMVLPDPMLIDINRFDQKASPATLATPCKHPLPLLHRVLGPTAAMHTSQCPLPNGRATASVQIGLICYT